MKFRNPPVVEVWISVDFDPNENKRDWDLALVQQYVRECEEEFPKLQALHEQTIQVQETSPMELPRVTHQDVRIQAVRLWNSAGSRMLQLGDDQISVHVLKTLEEIPGYGKTRNAAEPKLSDYVRIFQPRRIRNATLHYLDIINIPKPSSGRLNLQDYFPQFADLPETPFGSTVALAFQFQVLCPVDNGPLFFSLQNLPSNPADNMFRFRIEWHKQSTEINTLDLQQVWKRMNAAHDYMWDCFTACLSTATMDLFDPISEPKGI